MSTTYWHAPDVELIAEKLIPEHHDHLARHDVVVRCLDFAKAVSQQLTLPLGDTAEG